jgi:hypothetical protein
MELRLVDVFSAVRLKSWSSISQKEEKVKKEIIIKKLGSGADWKAIKENYKHVDKSNGINQNNVSTVTIKRGSVIARIQSGERERKVIMKREE